MRTFGLSFQFSSYFFKEIMTQFLERLRKNKGDPLCVIPARNHRLQSVLRCPWQSTPTPADILLGDVNNLKNTLNSIYQNYPPRKYIKKTHFLASTLSRIPFHLNLLFLAA